VQTRIAGEEHIAEPMKEGGFNPKGAPPKKREERCAKTWTDGCVLELEEIPRRTRETYEDPLKKKRRQRLQLGKQKALQSMIEVRKRIRDEKKRRREGRTNKISGNCAKKSSGRWQR
jgi:hypothetical protein